MFTPIELLQKIIDRHIQFRDMIKNKTDKLTIETELMQINYRLKDITNSKEDQPEFQRLLDLLSDLFIDLFTRTHLSKGAICYLILIRGIEIGYWLKREELKQEAKAKPELEFFQ